MLWRRYGRLKREGSKSIRARSIKWVLRQRDLHVCVSAPDRVKSQEPPATSITNLIELVDIT